MKKYNTLFVVIFTALFVTLLTWILPITYLNGEFVTDVRSQIGLMDLFTYPTYTIYNFIYILGYVLLVGAFYAVLNKTGAYRQILDKIVKFLKGKEVLFTIIVVLLVSIIVSFTGFTYEAIIIFPFLIAIVLMLGYDKITAALVTLGPVITGIMGSTFSKIVSGTFNNILNANEAIVGYTDLIWAKVAILIVTNAILVLNIIFHARKKKNSLISSIIHPDKELDEIESVFVPEKAKEEKKKWPLITVLAITMLIIVVSTINWTGAFQITWFTDAITWFQELKLFGYPVWSAVSGSLVAFGNWSYNEYIVLLFIVIFIIKLIYRVKFEELVDAVYDGIKKYIYAAGVMIFAYTILIMISNHPVMLTMLKPLLEITDGFNSVTLAFSTFVSALFNSDFGYYTYGVLPLTYVTSYITDTSVYALCGLITQSMYGLAMLVAPTSVVLLFSLSSLKITYFEWLKNVWKLFLELLLVLFAIFTIILLII